MTKNKIQQKYKQLKTYFILLIIISNEFNLFLFFYGEIIVCLIIIVLVTQKNLSKHEKIIRMILINNYLWN